MKIPDDYISPPNVEAAKAIQLSLRSLVIVTDRLEPVQWIAGVDVAFAQNYTITQAAVALFHFPDLELVEIATATLPTCFPYIPGFLSFREIPGILEALKKLTIAPHLILCDGQGLAHPRRFGLACHLGILIDCPTIGVAKSRLVGFHDEVAPEKGRWKPLIDQGETVGAVLRTRTNVNPLYVSIGHRISLPTAIQYVLQSTTKYRLPETTRIADQLSKTEI